MNNIYKGLTIAFSFLTLLFKLNLISSRITVDAINDLELLASQKIKKIKK